MTPKGELMKAIQASPDEVVSVLLETLRKLKHKSDALAEPAVEEPASERLHLKNGILVVETGRLDGFDTTEFIKEMREERIQSQISKMNP